MTTTDNITYLNIFLFLLSVQLKRKMFKILLKNNLFIFLKSLSHKADMGFNEQQNPSYYELCHVEF